MIELLLSALLVLTPTATVAPIFEEIKLTDTLTLKAEYLPINAHTDHEGMLFSVEDFIVIQTELEFCGEACEVRLSHIKQSHLNTLFDVQRRCEEEYSTLQAELDSAVEANDLLRKQVDEERTWKSVFKWTTLGLTATFIGTSSYILLKD